MNMPETKTEEYMQEDEIEESSEKQSWFLKLKKGLQKTTASINNGINGLLTKSKLDQAMLDELEELLVSSDIGVKASEEIVKELAKERFEEDISDIELKEELAKIIMKVLKPVAKPLDIDFSKKPFVILVVGVNGTGKTTTIGKFAKNYVKHGLKVTIGAGDTFRAAAVSQIKIWGDRAGAEVISGEHGCDSASLAYKALEHAKKKESDVLMIDTAGRLHTKNDLMEELAKIVRVIKKIDESAPHAVMLTLDATTGQNAHAQVEVFQNVVNVSGLVVTKLDGTAKGGVLVALAGRFKLPIYAIGVGEAAEDLQPFEADSYAKTLVGLDS